MHLKDVRNSIRLCLACLVDRNFHTFPKNTPRTGRDFKITTRTKIASIENRKRKSRKRTLKKKTNFKTTKVFSLSKVLLTYYNIFDEKVQSV